MTRLKNTPSLGGGIFTPPDISLILSVPRARINWYINEIWDNRFGRLFNERYSWNINNHKAVNFLVLVEFAIVLKLRALGLSTRKIFQARKAIAKELKIPYPFATSDLLAHPRHIWYRIEDSVVDADGTAQLNFADFVDQYCKNIHFGDNSIAERLWPRGKTNAVIVDPHHQFGQPVIEGTNITTRTIYSMHLSGDTPESLSSLYEIPVKQIEDAVAFHKQAA